MSSNAPSQFLGYAIQLPRALLRLLQSTLEGSVAIELDGDVSAMESQNLTLTEEDKSSVVGNHLGDKSENLWKTFYNWVKMVKDKNLDITNIRFVLYTNNRPKEGSIVFELDNIKTDDAASCFISSKLKKLRDGLPDNHRIEKYLNPIETEYIDEFKAIIKNFDFESNENTSEIYSDIDKTLREKFIQEENIKDIRESLLGWVLEQVTKKLGQKEPSIISYNEFHNYAMSLFQKYRLKQLIDYAIKTDISKDSLEKTKKSTFVRQLEFIDLEDDEIVENIYAYLKSNINRTKWIENELVDEESMTDFEERLISFHKNRHKHIQLTQKEFNDKEKGKILLYDCQARQELLNNQTPPDKTISGTYHTLSESKLLGWHKDWKILLKELDKETYNNE